MIDFVLISLLVQNVSIIEQSHLTYLDELDDY